MWHRIVIVFLIVVVVVMGIIEVPDWTRALSIMGLDGSGDAHILVVDTNGNLVAVIKGDDAGTLRTIAVDPSGQLYTLIRGSGGEDIAVDVDGNLAALMKGIDGVTLRTVAVDSSGNIVAVIKGNYLGTLKTLATDAAGHLQVVPYDPEDIWGYAIAMGNAELAASLSPAHRYDRRGNIQHIDTFDHGLRGVVPVTYGAGSAIGLSSKSARTGAYSVKLTAGAAVDRYAGFYVDIPHYSTTKVGGEFSFTKLAIIGYVRLFLVEYDGTNYRSYGLRWVNATGNIEYWSSEGVWTATGQSMSLYTNDKLYNTMKLVVDPQNHKYVRWMLNALEGTLDGIDPETGDMVTEGHIIVGIRAYGSASGAGDTYIDDVIVTKNEPPNE